MGEIGGGMSEAAARFTSEEEAKAQVDIYRYILGFSEMAAVKCAIQLGIADVLESHKRPITLGELSSSLNCSPSLLHRIMRFLIHRGIFKLQQSGAASGYVQTPLSSLLRKHGEKSMAAFVMLETSPVMLAPWHGISMKLMTDSSAFEDVHGEDVWKYAGKTPVHSKLINDAMACHAREAVRRIVDDCPEVFDGIKTMVDVGGGDGTTISMLVKAFPWIHGINFDLPHVVVSAAATCDNDMNVDHVGGDMFQSVPKADAAFLMWVLHDWGDDECINILENCREAIKEENGKVVIAEAVLVSSEEEEEENDDDEKKKKKKKVSSNDIGLMLDMVMMAHTTNGKERTCKEWRHILKAAGFATFTFTKTQTFLSLIQAYP